MADDHQGPILLIELDNSNAQSVLGHIVICLPWSGFCVILSFFSILDRIRTGFVPTQKPEFLILS